MKQETTRLIAEVRARPAIWQVKHPHHKFKNIVKKLWNEVHSQFPDMEHDIDNIIDRRQRRNSKNKYEDSASSLGLGLQPYDQLLEKDVCHCGSGTPLHVHIALSCSHNRKRPAIRADVTQLKKKWKNLKDTYRKELKKNPQMHTSDPDSTYKSQWHCFNDLDFLKDECRDLIEEDEDKSTASDNELQENFGDVTPAIRTSPSVSPTNHVDRPFKRDFDASSDYTELDRKRRKIKERDQALLDNERKSDDYHFLMSVLPEMRKLHPIQKIRLRNKINQALLEEMTLAMYGDPLNYESNVQVKSDAD